MDDGKGASLGGRILLALLTLYALTMIAPDLIRIVRPLGAFGVATNVWPGPRLAGHVLRT